MSWVSAASSSAVSRPFGHLLGEVVVGQQPFADHRRSARRGRRSTVILRGRSVRRRPSERRSGCGRWQHSRCPAGRARPPSDQTPSSPGQREVGDLDLDPEVDRLVRLEIGIVVGIEVLEILVEQPAADRVVRLRIEGLIQSLHWVVIGASLRQNRARSRTRRCLVMLRTRPVRVIVPSRVGSAGFDRGQGDVDQPDRLLGGGVRRRDQARRDHARHRQQRADQSKRTPPPHPPILSAVPRYEWRLSSPAPAMLGRVGQRV